jgi:hypothetical protein
VKHHGPIFAVLLAHSIGYRKPLIDRLRDPAVEKTDDELKFAADALDGGVKWPNSRSIARDRKRLRIAAYYLEFARGEPGRGQKGKAENSAAGNCGILDTREVRRAVLYAKTVRYGQWRWWDIASRMARKGKIEQLHRTY